MVRCFELLDHKVSKVLNEIQVLLDLQVHKVFKVYNDHKVSKVNVELIEYEVGLL